MINAKIGQFDILVQSARGTQHPPVLLSLPLKPGQGILPAGLLLEASAGGLVPYAAGAVAGVLDRDVDTAGQDSGLVIVHGSALRELLRVGVAAPADPDDTTLAALISMGVYPE